ncbi:MAG: hypothetical protein ACR2GZ_01450 [Solirubrobacteraceae bacterium]
MNDPPGVPSALGIEAVEWIAEGGANLTVRVTGRWRRRRPAWSGQPMLVIEAPGRRYRFPAMPEPPSLTGTGPGMWRISFSVPAALVPELGVRAWLQFGSVAVPLPTAVEFPGPETAEAGPRAVQAESDELAGDPLPSGGHPRPSSELESESARRRAEEAEAALSELTKLVQHLEGELAEARSRADQLAASVTTQQTSRRAAEQREHAERALRLDLARQLASRAKDTDRAREALGQLASAEERVRELEHELSEMRRLADEAEQAAATAAAARDRARRQASQAAVVARPPLAAAERSRLQFELALTARRSVGAVRQPDEPAPVALRLPLAPAPEPERSDSSVDPGADALITSLRRELELRAGAEAGLRTRLVEAETRLAAREHLARQATQTLSELRGELDGLRAAIERERAAREAAERRTAGLEQALDGQRERSRDAYAAIGELRGTLESLRQRHPPPAPPAPPPERADQPAARPEATVERPAEPERLNDALARLRERIPSHADDPPGDWPPDDLPDPDSDPYSDPDSDSDPDPVQVTDTGRAWLAPIFGKLVRSDPDRAGRLLVDLLPAQRALYDQAVSYDLVLGPAQSIRVTRAPGAPAVRRGSSPRLPGEVDFQVFGGHAPLARMVVAGWFRRRFGRRVARVQGRRTGVAALEALVGLHVDLASLLRLGVRFEPRTALVIIAGMIDRAQTAKQRFSLAYAATGEDELFLIVADGAPVEVTGARPRGQIAITIAGPVGSLERVVAGQRSPEVTVTGDDRPLALLREWVKHAQSG